MAPKTTDGTARVRAIASSLPDVEEGSSFGAPVFKVKGKFFAWFPNKKEVVPGTLGVKVPILERDFRIQERPNIFFFTPHYRDYPCVLANVDKMTDKALRELLESGHEYVMTTLKRPGARSRKR